MIHFSEENHLSLQFLIGHIINMMKFEAKQTKTPFAVNTRITSSTVLIKLQH